MPILRKRNRRTQAEQRRSEISNNARWNKRDRRFDQERAYGKHMMRGLSAQGGRPCI